MEPIYIAPPPPVRPEPDGPLRVLTSPSKQALAGVLLAIITATVAAIGLCSSPAQTREDPLHPWLDGEYDHLRYTETEVEEAVSYILTRAEVTRHRWWTDEPWRQELTTALVSAGESYSQPQLLLAGMAYRETVYTPERVGPAGERGILQVGKFCRRDPECRETCAGPTLADDVGCGSCCLHLGQRKCRSLYGGVVHYLSGKCSARRTGNPVRVERAAQARYRVWARTHAQVRAPALARVLGSSGELWGVPFALVRPPVPPSGEKFHVFSPGI